jgi:hypothetical protein
MKRTPPEPMSAILEKTGAVTTAQGPWRGFCIMVLAMILSRKSLMPWALVVAIGGGGTKWYGLW